MGDMITADLKQICGRFRDGILGDRESGMMGAAVCYPLQAYLSFLGQPTELQEVDLGRTNHVFLTLPSGRVLDPTADQFGNHPKVYVGRPLWFHRDKVRRP